MTSFSDDNQADCLRHLTQPSRQSEEPKKIPLAFLVHFGIHAKSVPNM